MLRATTKSLSSDMSYHWRIGTNQKGKKEIQANSCLT